jgi:hypothetical protein
MPTPQTPPSPSSNPPPLDPHPIVLQPAYPYFNQRQITALSSRLRGSLPENREVQIRLQACAWIEQVGNYLQWYLGLSLDGSSRSNGSPVRTIGTGMMLYLRFHLFNSINDFQFIVLSLILRLMKGCCCCMSICCVQAGGHAQKAS